MGSGENGQGVTLQGIVRHLEARGRPMTRSAVQRFHEHVAGVLGATGTLYPPESLPWWEAIAEGREDKKIQIRPESAAGWLELLMARESAAAAAGADQPQPATGDRLALIDQRGAAGELLPVAGYSSEQAERFLRAVEGIAAGMAAGAAAAATAPVLDPLLTAEEAMRESGLSITTLRKLPSVKEGRSRKWFRSTVAGYLSDLRLSVAGK